MVAYILLMVAYGDLLRLIVPYCGPWGPIDAYGCLWLLYLVTCDGLLLHMAALGGLLLRIVAYGVLLLRIMVYGGGGSA